MVIPKIIPATAEHIALIAPMVRHADIEEVWAASMQSPEQAMRRGLKYSSHVFTAFIGDEPLCMWGLVEESLVGEIGVPWMISTTLMDRYAAAFIRHCHAQLVQALSVYNKLVNYVDARNVRAIRWLEWMGFEIEEKAQPFGALSLPFYKFTMWRS